jgi:hypothetical protein
MSLDELRELLDRHVRPDGTTAIDGVRICKVDRTVSPESSMSGTVPAVVARGGKRLALGDLVTVAEIAGHSRLDTLRVYASPPTTTGTTPYATSPSTADDLKAGRRQNDPDRSSHHLNNVRAM